jgi:hypothetical protein
MKWYIFILLNLVVTACSKEESEAVRMNKYARALNLANYLMDKHNLWDKDGSDEMAEFLDIVSKIDSIQ